MSLAIIVYFKQLSNDYILEIMKRLNDFETLCEVHADCPFNSQEGFY